MHEVRSIQEILSQISRGEILLPEFQRGYVWNRDQVRSLARSLYRNHPTGHLLIWRTYKPSLARGAEATRDGHSLMLLDGQQRLTTLYVLFKGKAPRFYEGEHLFFDLHFNMETEEFRFWQKSLMAKNPTWLSVHEFLHEGLNRLLGRIGQFEAVHRLAIQRNLASLSRLDQIRNYTYTVDQVSGDEFSVEEVVDIFNRVNRAGTPLTKADLALAHICTIWPEARADMRTFQAKMARHGFRMDFGFIVRCLAGVATGSVSLEGSFLKTLAENLRGAWAKMQPAFEHLVSVLRYEAFIGDTSDLPTNYVLIPVTIFLSHHGGTFPDEAIKKRFIRWIYLAGLWARYSGSTQTKLQRDVALVSGKDTDPTHELVQSIRRERGRVKLERSDLYGRNMRSAVGRLSRVVARARNARDWFSSTPLFDKRTGQSNEAKGQLHYIFSKFVIDKAGFGEAVSSKQRNEIANRAFVTKRPSLKVRRSSPADYFPDVQQRQRGALRAQSIPMDPELWLPRSFASFLIARRRLLAHAMNEYIASWIPDDHSGETGEGSVRRLMADGEGDRVEFKSSLRWDWRMERVNKDLEKVVIKTLAGFLNGRDGGTLLIGVNDKGAPVGISSDYLSLKKRNRDGFELHLRQIVASAIGEAASTFLTVTFHSIDGQDICHVAVDPSDHPIYVDDKKEAVFYLRLGNLTKALPVNEAVKYVHNRWT